MTITLLLHSGDKTLKAIQQIVISTKVTNLAKRVTGKIGDLAMMTKKKQMKKQRPFPKANEECFYCGKRKHYTKDCYLAIKRKSKEEKVAEEAKRAR